MIIYGIAIKLPTGETLHTSAAHADIDTPEAMVEWLADTATFTVTGFVVTP